MKKIPYGKQSINTSDVRKVAETLRSVFLTQGPEVALFEKKLAATCGAKYAVAVSSGTTALHIAYLAAGLKKGDEVVTTPNTFVATANMILAVGARPVFCDIRDDTYNMDEQSIKKHITKRTKAIVPVHFAGQPCDMDTILRLAKKHKLLVIEDACHALGAKYKDRKIGSVGDMTVFSFHPVKSITTGEGGAVVTNNKEFYERMLRLRNHGLHKDKKGFNVMTRMGYNYRITDIQCALGISQLGRLSSFIKKRRERVRWYCAYFGKNPPVILPEQKKSNMSAHHLFIVRVKNKNDRLPLFHFLQKRGIGVNFHYPSVYSHPYYRSHGYAKTRLVRNDLYHETAITLPLFPDLRKEDVLYVVSCIFEYFNDVKSLKT